MNGWTPLHSAAANGNLESVHKLLESGGKASMTVVAGTHGTPLHQAVAKGKLESVRLLLRIGTSEVSTTVVASQYINYADKNGITPLLRAAMKLHVKVFIELKSHGGDIFLSDSFGLRFCDWCLLNQERIDTINQFCKACGIKCDGEDLVGIISTLCAKKLFDINRVLCLAAIKGNVDVFDAMVTSKSSLDHQWLPKAGLILSFDLKNTEIYSDLHISSEPLNPLHIALLSVSMRKVYNHAFIEKLISHPRTRYTINEVFPNGLSPLDVARQFKAPQHC